MNEKAEKIIRRFDSMWARDSNFRNLWQDTADHMWPRQNSITVDQTSGTERTDQLYDVTGVFASQDAAAGLLSITVPTGQKFFALVASKPELNEIEAVSRWFDKATDVLHEWLAKSNFLLQLIETLRSMITFGTGNLFVKRGDKTPLAFRDYPIGSYVCSEDDDGFIDTVYRKFPLTVIQAAQKAEEEGWNIHKDILALLSEEKRLNDKFWFIHAVEPRKNYNKQFLSNTNMPWSSVYVDVKHKEIVSESGFPLMPYNVARFTKASDEVMGRGPGTFILPVVRQLQQIKEDLNDAADLHVNPPLEVLDSFEGEVKTYKSAVNVVLERESINRLDIAGDFPIGKEDLEAERDVVRKAFYLDLFNLLIEERTQTKTAFETNELIQEKLQKLGPAAGRLNRELFNPIIIRSLNILIEEELIERPPAELSGEEFDIEYLGALNLALRNQQTTGFVRWVDMVTQASAIKEEVVDIVNFDEGLKEAGRNLGVKQNAINSDDEVSVIREKRRQAEAAAAQLEAAVKIGQASQALPNLGKAPEEGSPAKALVEGA